MGRHSIVWATVFHSSSALSLNLECVEGVEARPRCQELGWCCGFHFSRAQWVADSPGWSLPEAHVGTGSTSTSLDWPARSLSPSEGAQAQLHWRLKLCTHVHRLWNPIAGLVLVSKLAFSEKQFCQFSMFRNQRHSCFLEVGLQWKICYLPIL